MSTQVFELAEQIKEKGQRAQGELPTLLRKALMLAQDETQDVLTRALAHRAAGNAFQLLNQFEPALESYNTAAWLLETVEEPIELGRTLHAKVGMLFSLSRFDELFECSTRARELFEQCGDRKRLARLDVNLAHAYHRLGRHKQALECSERAILILEGAEDFEGLAAASINSAVTLTAMHEFERAEERYRSAMRLASERNLSSWVLLSRYNLAYLRYLGGDTGEALREFETIRKEYERVNNEWLVCQCWLDEAEILLEVGDLGECIRVAQKAQFLSKKLGLNSELAKSLLYEAAAGLRLGKCQEAMELLQEATRRFDAEGNNVLTAASKLQTALFRGERGDAAALADAESARSLLENSGLPHCLALANIVIGRIQRANGRRISAVDSFQSALRLADSGRSQWMQFHACYELGLSLAGEDSQQLFHRAEGMLDSLWDRLGSDELKMSFLVDRENVYTHLVRSTIDESPVSAFEFSEKARSRVLRERLLHGDLKNSAAEIRSKLAADETIVEYFITGDDLCIFVVRADALICVQRRGVVGLLQTHCQDLDRHLSSLSVKWERLARVRHHLHATALFHLHYLYNELLGPVRSELRGRIVLVPHGFIHGIPLHALYDGEHYLAELHEVAYSASASLYCAPPEEQPFGDPLLIGFSKDARSSNIREVEEVATYLNRATVLVNPSVGELRQAFEQPRLLVHLAGHAGIDGVAGRLSWIETADGQLTSRDLIDMHIRAKTLVITGCQTARRMIQAGDEWLGLMRAFYLSGASAIVSALWDIRDESAVRFAREFYRIFNHGNVTAAVQNAAASVRNWQTHPYFWAGFGAFVRKIAEDL